MPRRGTLLFVLLVVVLTSAGYLLRTWSMEHRLREHDDVALQHSAAAVAAAVHGRSASHGKIDAAFLRPFLGERMGVRVHRTGEPDVEVRTVGFHGVLDPSDGNANLWATAGIPGGGYVLLSEDGQVIHDTAWQSLPVMLLVLLVVVAIAAGVGALLARANQRPFHRLAEAAAALGRGRFQLDLEPSHVPAANEIGQALEASARQLQERMASEEELAQRASHILRTPLTGLRLELEEAVLLDGMPVETVAALERALARVDQLDAVTGELVALARHRALVADAAIDLESLAHLVTQRWADELDVVDRTLTAAVEGDTTTTYTPGPVEQILELLLADVIHRSAGSVRLVFTAAREGHLRITVTAESAVTVRKAATAPMLRARTIALALGGRLEGEYAEGGVEIVLPRR